MSTKNRETSFLYHAIVYGAGAILMQTASIVLLPLYTRYLSPADFGVLDLIYRVRDVLVLCLMANGIRMTTLTFYQQAISEEERARTAATVTAGHWFIPGLIRSLFKLLLLTYFPVLFWFTCVIPIEQKTAVLGFPQIEWFHVRSFFMRMIDHLTDLKA